MNTFEITIQRRLGDHWPVVASRAWGGMTWPSGPRACSVDLDALKAGRREVITAEALAGPYSVTR